jgi:hypothetical protein
MKTEKALRAEIRSLKIRNQTLARELRITREKDVQLMRLTDTLYRNFDENADFKPRQETGEVDGISFIIAAYNIPGQLIRTLTSCTPYYQNIEPSKLEIIVVDNGSDVALTLSDFRDFPRVTQVIRVDGHPSPVHGLNLGVEAATFSNVALMIDGAHLLSPGVFNNARAVLELMGRPVINVPQYILGAASQNLRTIENAYAIEAEDLKKLGWPGNGYALFDYAVMAGENPNKSYLDAIESNCLITTKAVLKECGAYDERFDEPGAGLANIEIFNRLCHDPKNQYVALPGEGSFHQDHGGTTTSLSSEERDRLVSAYYEKYKSLTGNERNFSLRGPFVFGDVSACNRMIPTISLEYGQARNKVLRQLADIYVHRVRFSQHGEVPSLTLKPQPADERKIRPILPPLGLAKGQSPAKYGYRNVLKKVHSSLLPRRYFEIGIDDGGSLSLAKCPGVGVDPDFELISTLESPMQIFRMESDRFFADRDLCEKIFSEGVDLAFIDGMHLAEYVLRDFINVEKWAGDNCVVVIDDVYPEQFAMAQRDRQFNAWCGDVYKIVPILKQYRPDLNINVFEAFAGPYRKGVALISNLDPSDSSLSERSEQIASDIENGEYAISSIEELESMIPATDIDQLGVILEAVRAGR